MIIGGPRLKYYQNKEIPSELYSIISYAKNNVYAYKDLPDPDLISNFKDFQMLPLIDTNKLVGASENFKSRNINIYRISSSGGTTGIPKILYRTYEDHLFSSKVAAEMFETSSINDKDVVAILHPFDVWGISFIALEALRFLNATALPLGSSFSDEQCIQWFSKFKPSVLYATPSRSKTIAEIYSNIYFEKIAWAPRALLLAGEPIIPDDRFYFKNIFNSEVFSIYGSEETDGLGSECSFHNGIHFVEKGIIYEIIDPETLLPTEANTGLLVVTPLGWRGTVLIRYILGDIVELDFSPCKCGKSTPRIIKIKRKIKGFYLWDSIYINDLLINNVFQNVFGREYPYQCIISDTKPPQNILILIDLPHKIGSTENIKKKIYDRIVLSSPELANALLSGDVYITIQFCSRSEFQKTERGKTPKFIFDKRHKE